MDGQYDRLPPHDLDAERCVLGSMAIDPDAIPVGIGILSRQDFFLEDNAEIFAAMERIWTDGKKLDAVTLRAELTDRGKLELIGGTAYIAQILQTVPSSAHIEHYAEIVRDRAMWRGLIAASNESLREAYTERRVESGADAVQAAMNRLAMLVTSRESSKCVKLGDVALGVYDAIVEGKRVTLVRTGVPGIDEEIGGVAIGEEMIIGARPSMGKSTLGRQIAASAAAIHGIPTVIISNEESREKIAQNLLSAYGRVENNKLRRGGLDAPDLIKLSDGLAKIAAIPVYIIDRAFRINRIRAELAQVVARHGVKLVVVDYLQRIDAGGKDRYEKVTNASLEISRLIKELNVAGIVMAQLNRALTQRQDKRPTMSDLRESGQIEQDADQIIFLHREDYYRKTGEADGAMDRVAELILSKVRDGVRGETIKLKTSLRYQWFDEWQAADPWSSGQEDDHE